MMTYEEWADSCGEEMEIAFGESGADREADFDFDDAMEKAYEEYRVAEAK
jgi:hypothetical protein